MCSLNPRKTILLSGEITNKKNTLQAFLSDRHINLALGSWQMSVSQLICYRNDNSPNYLLLGISTNCVSGFLCNNQGQSEKHNSIIKKIIVNPKLNSSPLCVDFQDKFFLINNPNDEICLFIDVEQQSSKKEYSITLQIIIDFQRIQ